MTIRSCAAWSTRIDVRCPTRNNAPSARTSTDAESATVTSGALGYAVDDDVL
jgi:hypothetical protein